MTPEIINGICQHIDSKAANSVLWVSEDAADVPAGLNAKHCLPDSADLQKKALSNFDYAVLSDLPGQMDKAAAEALLAGMRDINAQKVFWVLGKDAPWTAKEALALGFRQLQHSGASTLYGFDIDNYKTTPDWLNAKNWANPERWDKSRW